MRRNEQKQPPRHAAKARRASRARGRLEALLPPSDLPAFTTPRRPDLPNAPFRQWPTVDVPPGERAWRTWLYLLCYAVGAFTLRAARRVWTRLLIPLGRVLRRGWQRLWRRPRLTLRWEMHRIRYGFTLAGERLRAAAAQSWWRAAGQALALPFLALRRHRRFLQLVFQAMLLAGSALVLTLVIRYWQDTTFALELVYDGRVVGYIEEESVFQNAVDMAEGRILKTTQGYVIEREAHMTLRPAQQSEVLGENALCDEILKLSGSSVCEMSGLYIDGMFEGALLTRDQMQALLDDILAENDTEAVTTAHTAEFMRTVEIVDGLYPVGTEETYEALRARLTAPDEEGQPYLGVQIRCTEVYTEPIPFARETVKDSTKYIGYSAVRTAGQEGERQITAEVVYVNGEERYRSVLSEATLREPVTEVTVEGSYRVSADAQPGVATGTFMWPLPSCRTISSPFGYRGGKLHAGIDISGNGVYGKDILAADGGRVSQVNASGWGGGYGLYVIIDHGNGYATVYAHCSEILVSAGETVTQGQLIARAGNSGNSGGAHLHFEIRVNGVSTDPTPYLQ